MKARDQLAEAFGTELPDLQLDGSEARQRAVNEYQVNDEALLADLPLDDPNRQSRNHDPTRAR